MPEKYGPIRGLTGTSFLDDDTDFYLQNANYRNKLEKVCEKYGIRPRLEPGEDHVRMWAEIGAALAEEYEGFGKRRGRPRLGEDESSSDEVMARFVEAAMAEGYGDTPTEVLRKWRQVLQAKKPPREKLSKLQTALHFLPIETLQKKVSSGRKMARERPKTEGTTFVFGLLNQKGFGKKIS